MGEQTEGFVTHTDTHTHTHTHTHTIYPADGELISLPWPAVEFPAGLQGMWVLKAELLARLSQQKSKRQQQKSARGSFS